MSATPIDIAEAIKDLINAAVVAGSFTFTFTAVRAYVPPFVLEEKEVKGLEVFVSPATHGVGKLTRGTNLHQVGVAVSVIHKPENRSNEAIDPLVDLVEALKLLCVGKVVVSSQSGNSTINEEPIYRPEQLINSGIFWGAFTVVVNLPRTPS